MGPRHADGKFERALVVAAVLHGVLVAFTRGSWRRPAPVPPPAEPLVWIEAPPENAQGARDPIAEPPEDAREPGPSDKMTRRVVGAVAAALAPVARPHEAPPVEPPAPRRALSIAELGLGGPSRIGIPAPEGTPASPSSAAAPASELKLRVDDILREPLVESDRVKGLGPDGPILAALTTAAYANTAPDEGRASFDAWVDSEGSVRALDIVADADDNEAWRAVGRAALGKLAGSRVAIRGRGAGARGHVYRIEVTSRRVNPSGRDPGIAWDLFRIPVNPVEGRHRTSISLLDPIPVPRVEPCNRDRGGIGTPCDPRPRGVVFPVFTLRGDPVDLAVHARRVVHAHTVNVRPMP
jgi:hypothetical protein